MRLLIIEDNQELADLMKQKLSEFGYVCDVAYDGIEGDYKASDYDYDAILLDLNLPDKDGFELLEDWRKQGFNVPVLIVSARDELDQRIKGLQLGSDDYITKPFDLREVIARVKTVLRRYEKIGPITSVPDVSILSMGELMISEKEWSVTRNNQRIDLTPKEFELLLFFAKHPRQVFTRSQLLDQIWGYDFEGDTRTVDIHIQRLRKKLDLGDRLITVFGVGYKYEPQKEN